MSKEHGIVTGPTSVHVSTYPMMLAKKAMEKNAGASHQCEALKSGGVLSPKSNACEADSGSAFPAMLRAKTKK